MKNFNLFFLVMVTILSINAFPRAGNDFPGLRITDSEISLKAGEKKIKIKEVDIDDKDYEIRLVIDPADIIVQTGSKIQFKAFEIDTSGKSVETTVVWELIGDPIGTIDYSGLLEVQSAGLVIVKAKLNGMAAAANIIAIDSTIDDELLNVIIITRIPENPN